MTDITQDLLRRIQLLERQAVRYRQGVVTDDAPLTVDLGASGAATQVANVGDDLSVDDTAAVLSLGNDLLAIGAVRPGGLFVGQLAPSARTSPPPGWLTCAGQSLLRASYAALFAAIGTTYGSADGTHFTLPDLRGRIPVGLDNQGGTDAGRLAAANTLGGTGGEETHLLTAAESGVAAHSHPPAVSSNYMYRGNGSGLAGAGSSYGEMNASSASTGTNDTAPASSAHNNMPPYLLVSWLIYAGA